jgi:hypothetical protein
MVTMQGKVQTDSLTLRLTLQRMAVERFTATGLDLPAATEAALRRSLPWLSTPNPDATADANSDPSGNPSPASRSCAVPTEAPAPRKKTTFRSRCSRSVSVTNASKSVRGTIRTTRPIVEKANLYAARIGGYQICQIAAKQPFDRLWPSQIRKVASLSAQALMRHFYETRQDGVRRCSAPEDAGGRARTAEASTWTKPGQPS